MDASGRKELFLSDLGKSDQVSDPKAFRKYSGLLSTNAHEERVPNKYRKDQDAWRAFCISL